MAIVTHNTTARAMYGTLYLYIREDENSPWILENTLNYLIKNGNYANGTWSNCSGTDFSSILNTLVNNGLNAKLENRYTASDGSFYQINEVSTIQNGAYWSEIVGYQNARYFTAKSSGTNYESILVDVTVSTAKYIACFHPMDSSSLPEHLYPLSTVSGQSRCLPLFSNVAGNISGVYISSFASNLYTDSGGRCYGTARIEGSFTHFILNSSTVLMNYLVQINAVSHGVASANETDVPEGTTVTVTFTPDTGYSVDWDNVTITTIGAATVLIKDTDTTGHFTMPAGDVTINPVFVQALTAGVTVSGGHGTATISNAHPAQGDTVTITCYPDSGYEVDTVTSFDATISKVATNQYQFTMPNVDVLATVTFKETPFFNVTVEATPNGTVSASPSSGYSGTTITLTVAPNAGYNLQRLYVLAGTDTVPVTKVDDTHYTFVLPSFNVVVRAKFWDGDPYSPGGNSEPSEPGGTGSFDNTTTPITPPAIPSVSVQDTGLYTIFSLTQAQLNDFTNYLWSDLFSLPTVTKYLNNATDHILSLHILPFNVNVGSAREIKFMGVGTGVNGLVVTNQHQHINCGSILLEEYYGSAMDYNPWTKIKAYVPYCGEIDLDPDEVMNRTISLQYTVDILTGDCYANISADDTTLYQISGNCAMRLPVSSSNWASVLNAVKSAVMLAAGVGSVAMGAVGAGMASFGAATIGQSYKAGDVAGMDSGLDMLRAGQSLSANRPQVGTTNSYMSTMASKSSYVHTGIQTGGAGFMAVQVPYLLIKRPRQQLPENFNQYVGYPAHYTRTLGNMSGFTKIIDWNPAAIPCTEGERAEIDSLLKQGVIL